MMNNNLAIQSLSEATAIRLFNSVTAAEQTLPIVVTNPSDLSAGEKSIESMGSINSLGNSCRICRWNRSDLEVIQCPCHCKGSVGFVHLQCLKRWILHRRQNHCEICNEEFVMPVEKFNICRMFKNFWTQSCAGAIMKHALFGASCLPLAHIVLQQVLVCMENINQSPHEQMQISEVLVASCALFTSSALFFQFFEFITIRLFLVRNILRQWWTFGNADADVSFVELESEIFEFF